MMKRGKSRREKGNKRRGIKTELLNNFDKSIKKNNKKKIIVGGVIVSVLSFSCVGYFQGKNALASSREVYKSLVISDKAENISTITPYDKLIDGEDINVLFLGDESYLGDIILEEDVKSFIESTYNSKVKLTNLSEDNASIYEQLNQYINIEDREFDLVFLCFENHDEREISKTNFSGIYESILRDLKYNNTSVDIIPVVKHETLVSDTYYQIINGLAKYYDLDLAKVNEKVVESGIEGESVADFRDSYSRTLTNVIENNINNKKEINTEYKDAYYGVTTLFEPYKVTVKGEKKKGFSVSQSRAKSDSKNDYIRYKVDGNIVGLGYETSTKGGVIEIYVNRVLYRRIDTKADVEDFRYVLISSNLSGTNEIKIVNSNGGDITLLGVITSGNNTDSKEVEGLNNILARNTGDYTGQVKDDSLYENAKKEVVEKVEEAQKTQTKKGGSTSSSSSPSQSIPSRVTNNESKNTSPSSNNSQVESIPNNDESSNSVNEGGSIIQNNQNQQNGGDSSGNNNHVQNNGGGNNQGNNNTNNVENNIQGNGGDINNGINSNIGNGGDSLNNNTDNTVNNGGDSSNNNANNSVNNNINSGGNTQNNNSGNSDNTTNNTASNNGSNEGNSGGESTGGQIQENTVNSNIQSSESAKPVGNSMESIPSE